MTTQTKLKEDHAREDLASHARSLPRAVLQSSNDSGPYADLEGGHGREVSFRPNRFGCDDLVPLRPIVRVATAPGKSSDVDETRIPIDCTLEAVSQSGVAFRWPCDVPIQVGRSIQELAILFDDYEAYRGEGLVRSLRGAGDHRIVGASFTDSLLNVEDLLHLRDIKRWSTCGFTAVAWTPERAWQVAGHERFKALTAELNLYLQDAARTLCAEPCPIPYELRARHTRVADHPHSTAHGAL